MSDKNKETFLAKLLQDVADLNYKVKVKKKSSNDFAFGEKIPIDILESEYKEKFVKEELEKISKSNVKEDEYSLKFFTK